MCILLPYDIPLSSPAIQCNIYMFMILYFKKDVTANLDPYVEFNIIDYLHMQL